MGVEKSSQTLKRATMAFNYSTQRGYGGAGGYGPSNGGFVGGYGGVGYGYGGDPLGQLGNGVASQQFQHQAYQPAGTASSFQGQRPAGDQVNMDVMSRLTALVQSAPAYEYGGPAQEPAAAGLYAPPSPGSQISNFGKGQQFPQYRVEGLTRAGSGHAGGSFTRPQEPYYPVLSRPYI